MKREGASRQDQASLPSFLETSGTGELRRQGSESMSSQVPLIVDYWRLINREKLMLLLPAMVLAILFAVIVLNLPPTYRAAATVLFEGEQRRPVSFEDVYRGLTSDQGAHVTQAEFLRTRDVALRVIRKLALTELAEFQPPAQSSLAQSKPVRMIREWLPGPVEADHRPPDAEEFALRRFRSVLRVDRLNQTQLFTVTFESGDPTVAASVANEVVAAYIRADMDARYEATKEANAWLSDRLASLEHALDGSEKALQDYRQRHGLLARTQDLATDRQLAEITQRLMDTKMQRTGVEQSFVQASSRDLQTALASPAVAANPLVIRAREAEASAEKRLAELGNQLGTAHPQYRAVANELLAARETLRQEVSSAARTIGRELAALRAAEQQMENDLKSVRIEGQSRDQKGVELNQLEREVAINRQLYETFLARNKEIAAASDFKQPAATLVDPAVPPSAPTRPPFALMASFGACLGGIGGFLVVLVRDRLRNTLRRTEDVEERLEETLLAAVPKLGPSEAARAGRYFLKEPDSLFAEAIRTVGTGVALATLDGMNSVVAVSSALGGEGKTTIACNLALALAPTRRVLLIDADLHRSSVCWSLGLDASKRGLAQLLDGWAALGECIQEVPGSALAVIPAGRVAGSALDLLLQERFRKLVAELQHRYDLIILDTPPVQLVSDTMVLGRVVTTLIMVTRSEQTPLPVVRRALRRVRAAGVSVLGVILNAHDFKRADRYYGEHSGYKEQGYLYASGPPRSRKRRNDLQDEVAG